MIVRSWFILGVLLIISPQLLLGQSLLGQGTPKVRLRPSSDNSIFLVVTRLSKSFLPAKVTIRIKNSLGQIVSRERYQQMGTRFVYSLPNLPPSLYTVRVAFRSAARGRKKTVRNSFLLVDGDSPSDPDLNIIPDPEDPNDFPEEPPAPPPDQNPGSPPPNPYQNWSYTFDLCPTAMVNDTFARINQIRVSSGLFELAMNETLQAAATIHSDRMAQLHLLTHDGWLEEIFGSGFIGHTFGQNIAVYPAQPFDVVEDWISSPSHRTQILNGNYTESGLGCIIDDHGHIWWSQDFGG